MGGSENRDGSRTAVPTESEMTTKPTQLTEAEQFELGIHLVDRVREGALTPRQAEEEATRHGFSLTDRPDPKLF